MAYKVNYEIRDTRGNLDLERGIQKFEFRLYARFNFSKDIENPYNYMFLRMAPHAKDIAKRIKGDFLHKYILSKGFLYDTEIVSMDYNNYIYREHSCQPSGKGKIIRRLGIDSKNSKGFRLIAYQYNVKPEDFDLDMIIDLNALNEAIITGKR